jgi:hypothetical protein
MGVAAPTAIGGATAGAVFPIMVMDTGRQS